MIRQGAVAIRVEYRDPGDEEFTRVAMDDESRGRVDIQSIGHASASEIRDLRRSYDQGGYKATNNSMSASANIGSRLEFWTISVAL